jgi:hypothetical protein
MTQRVLGVAHLVVAAAAAIAAAVGLTRLLPVTALLAGSAVPVATVSLAAAVAMLSVAIAVCRFGPDRWRAIERSQVAGIAVFLVAQLNGITEVTALVPLYALASGATLVLAIMVRDRAEGQTGRRPFGIGAAVGIVPWGVIAFQQIGSLMAGAGPDATVRVLTLVVLALSAGQWAAVWRGADRAAALLSGATIVALLLAAVLPAI